MVDLAVVLISRGEGACMADVASHAAFDGAIWREVCRSQLVGQLVYSIK